MTIRLKANVPLHNIFESIETQVKDDTRILSKYHIIIMRFGSWYDRSASKPRDLLIYTYDKLLTMRGPEHNGKHLRQPIVKNYIDLGDITRTSIALFSTINNNAS